MVSCPSLEGSVVYCTVVRNALAMARQHCALGRRDGVQILGPLEVQFCHHQIKGPHSKSG